MVKLRFLGKFYSRFLDVLDRRAAHYYEQRLRRKKDRKLITPSLRCLAAHVSDDGVVWNARGLFANHQLSARQQEQKPPHNERCLIFICRAQPTAYLVANILLLLVLLANLCFFLNFKPIYGSFRVSLGFLGVP